MTIPDDDSALQIVEAGRARLHARNAAGAHAFAVSDDEFDQITSYFVPPDPGEGFTIQVETYATP